MISITIECDDQGRVGVNGPLQHKLICLGLLDVARDIILKHQVPADKPLLLVPKSVIPSKVNGA